MKKETFYNLSNASRCEEIEKHFVKAEVNDEKPMERHNPDDVFLKIVYSVDDRTRCPKGDLQYLVSDKVNPEVKQWVLQHLMTDMSAAAFRSQVKGLSDDDIASLAMQPNETVSEYCTRVNKFMMNNADTYERLGNAYIKSMETKRNVPIGDKSTTVSSE